MAFPETSLPLRVELGLGGGRVDVTDRVYTRDPIRITRSSGMADDRADPSTCSLTLNAGDGALSPLNPSGPWYGQLGPNTPVYVTLPYGESYLDVPGGGPGSGASTPDHSSLDITGDLDVRVEITTTWRDAYGPWRTLIGKWGEPSQRSWIMTLSAGGVLSLFHSADGTTSRT
ncbi:hypothetical protein ACZ91_63380, partial [Streptomyces regensis]